MMFFKCSEVYEVDYAIPSSKSVETNIIIAVLDNT